MAKIGVHAQLLIGLYRVVGSELRRRRTDIEPRPPRRRTASPTLYWATLT